MDQAKKKYVAPKRVITHTVGEWSWNTNNLHKRLIMAGPDDCWSWRGSKNHHGNIFGAYKNGRPQMTQANRLFYMEQTGEPATDIAIRLSCGNYHCANPAHFIVVPNKRSTKPPVDQYELRIDEILFREILDKEREQLRAMVKELASEAGADWDLEYRWMRMPNDNLLVAKLKFTEVMQYLGIRKL